MDSERVPELHLCHTELGLGVEAGEGGQLVRAEASVLAGLLRPPDPAMREAGRQLTLARVAGSLTSSTVSSLSGLSSSAATI